MGSGELFDVGVVGAGPAGSVVAQRCAAAGLRVIAFDRSAVIGTPVRCGEAAGMSALREHVDVAPDWIGATVHGVTMVSPSGISVDVARMSEGVIVRRDVMDLALARRAATSGARLMTSTTIVGVRRDGEVYECVDHCGGTWRCRLLVIADGVESRIARMLGWRTAMAMEDMCTCAFCRVCEGRMPVDRIEMHYGSRVAPSGYAWVFPRGDGSANVGLGLLGSRSTPGLARECLSKFVQGRFGEVRVTDEHCGGVPVGQWTRPLVRGCAVIVGDAARQVDALSGGGITHAMHAARLASDAIIEAFRGGTLTQSALAAYERAWARGPGKVLMRTYALKQMVVGLDDATLDSIARKLNRGKPGGLSLAGICFAAFARRPLLLLKALMVYM